MCPIKSIEKADRSIESKQTYICEQDSTATTLTCLSSYQLKACSDILSSALNERLQPSPGPAVITSSESPHAGVLHA